MIQCHSRSDRGAWRFLFVLVALALLSVGMPARAAEESVHLLLGNPSAATADPATPDNFLMAKDYFALSYNSSKGTPNWVSWRLTKDDLGKAGRSTVFNEDSSLPQGLTRIFSKDYTGTGFDRGHMCPHSDRAKDNAMSFSTFVMTNIIPQAPAVNRGAWEHLESYCRDLVSREGKRLYITAGPAGSGGRGSEGFKTSIAKGKVTVPSMCWKVIVVLPEEGADDLAKVNEKIRVITVIMPNDNGLGLDWAPYRTSVSEVEKKTSLSFFGKVPSNVAEKLKAEADETHVPRPSLKPRED